MKGVRRTKRPVRPLGGGFADLMASPPNSTATAGVITGVTRTTTPLSPKRDSQTQSQASLSPRGSTAASSDILSSPRQSSQLLSPPPPQPPPPPPPPPPPTPSPHDDWESLLSVRPKRRISPNKSVLSANPSSSFSSYPLRRSVSQASSTTAEVVPPSKSLHDLPRPQSQTYPPAATPTELDDVPTVVVEVPPEVSSDSLQLPLPPKASLSTANPSENAKISTEDATPNEGDGGPSDFPVMDATSEQEPQEKTPDPATAGSVAESSLETQLDPQPDSDLTEVEPTGEQITDSPTNAERPLLLEEGPDDDADTAPKYAQPQPVSTEERLVTSSEQETPSPKTSPSKRPNRPEPAPGVPSFLSGWDGADGWGDDSVDDSDPDEDIDRGEGGEWGKWEALPEANATDSTSFDVPGKEGTKGNPSLEENTPDYQRLGIMRLSEERPPTALGSENDEPLRTPIAPDVDDSKTQLSTEASPIGTNNSLSELSPTIPLSPTTTPAVSVSLPPEPESSESTAVESHHEPEVEPVSDCAVETLDAPPGFPAIVAPVRPSNVMFVDVSVGDSLLGPSEEIPSDSFEASIGETVQNPFASARGIAAVKPMDGAANKAQDDTNVEFSDETSFKPTSPGGLESTDDWNMDPVGEAITNQTDEAWKETETVVGSNVEDVAVPNSEGVEGAVAADAHDAGSAAVMASDSEAVLSTGGEDVMSGDPGDVTGASSKSLIGVDHEVVVVADSERVMSADVEHAMGAYPEHVKGVEPKVEIGVKHMDELSTGSLDDYATIVTNELPVELVKESVPKPTSDPFSEPAGDPVVKPTCEPSEELVSAPLAHVTDTTVELVRCPSARLVGEALLENMDASPPQSSSCRGTEPVSNIYGESISEPSVLPATEAVAVAVAEAVVSSFSDLPVEFSANFDTDPQTDMRFEPASVVSSLTAYKLPDERDATVPVDAVFNRSDQYPVLSSDKQSADIITNRANDQSAPSESQTTRENVRPAGVASQNLIVSAAPAPANLTAAGSVAGQESYFGPELVPAYRAFAEDKKETRTEELSHSITERSSDSLPEPVMDSFFPPENNFENRAVEDLSVGPSHRELDRGSQPLDRHPNRHLTEEVSNLGFESSSAEKAFELSLSADAVDLTSKLAVVATSSDTTNMQQPKPCDAGPLANAFEQSPPISIRENGWKSDEKCEHNLDADFVPSNNVIFASPQCQYADSGGDAQYPTDAKDSDPPVSDGPPHSQAPTPPGQQKHPFSENDGWTFSNSSISQVQNDWAWDVPSEEVSNGTASSKFIAENLLDSTSINPGTPSTKTDPQPEQNSTKSVGFMNLDEAIVESDRKLDPAIDPFDGDAPTFRTSSGITKTSEWDWAESSFPIADASCDFDKVDVHRDNLEQQMSQSFPSLQNEVSGGPEDFAGCAEGERHSLTTSSSSPVQRAEPMSGQSNLSPSRRPLDSQDTTFNAGFETILESGEVDSRTHDVEHTAPQGSVISSYTDQPGTFNRSDVGCGGDPSTAQTSSGAIEKLGADVSISHSEQSLWPVRDADHLNENVSSDAPVANSARKTFGLSESPTTDANSNACDKTGIFDSIGEPSVPASSQTLQPNYDNTNDSVTAAFGGHGVESSTNNSGWNSFTTTLQADIQEVWDWGSSSVQSRVPTAGNQAFDLNVEEQIDNLSQTTTLSKAGESREERQPQPLDDRNTSLLNTVSEMSSVAPEIVVKGTRPNVPEEIDTEVKFGGFAKHVTDENIISHNDSQPTRALQDGFGDVVCDSGPSIDDDQGWNWGDEMHTAESQGNFAGFAPVIDAHGASESNEQGLWPSRADLSTPNSRIVGHDSNNDVDFFAAGAPRADPASVPCEHSADGRLSPKSNSDPQPHHSNASNIKCFGIPASEHDSKDLNYETEEAGLSSETNLRHSLEQTVRASTFDRVGIEKPSLSEKKGIALPSEAPFSGMSQSPFSMPLISESATRPCDPPPGFNTSEPPGASRLNELPRISQNEEFSHGTSNVALPTFPHANELPPVLLGAGALPALHIDEAPSAPHIGGVPSAPHIGGVPSASLLGVGPSVHNVSEATFDQHAGNAIHVRDVSDASPNLHGSETPPVSSVSEAPPNPRMSEPAPVPLVTEVTPATLEGGSLRISRANQPSFLSRIDEFPPVPIAMSQQRTLAPQEFNQSPLFGQQEQLPSQHRGMQHQPTPSQKNTPRAPYPSQTRRFDQQGCGEASVAVGASDPLSVEESFSNNQSQQFPEPQLKTDISDSFATSLQLSGTGYNESFTADVLNSQSTVSSHSKSNASGRSEKLSPLPTHPPPSFTFVNRDEPPVTEDPTGPDDVCRTSETADMKSVSGAYSALPTATLPPFVPLASSDSKVGSTPAVPPAPLSSGFAYPFSIMGQGVTNDVEHRTICPIISWGFGGALVVSIPSVFDSDDGESAKVNRSVRTSYRVKLYDLNSISSEIRSEELAASREAIPPFRLPVSNDELALIADMCDRLSVVSSGLSRQETEGSATMWKLLALMCRQKGNGWKGCAASVLSGPSSVRMFGRKEDGVLSATTGQSPFIDLSGSTMKSDAEQNEAGIEVERMMDEGNCVDALRIARESGLWSMAFVLASTLEQTKRNELISEYARATLKEGSTLYMLCLAIAGNYPEMEIKATSDAGLSQWKKSIGVLLTSWKTSVASGDGEATRFLKIIDMVGQGLLISKKDFVAAHTCFLLSGSLEALSPDGTLLLGADHRVPAGRPKSLGSLGAILQSLVFEAVCCAQGQDMCYHLLPFRFLLASEICNVGRPDVALAHCEWIVSIVKGVFQSGRNEIASSFTLPFLSSLETLDLRLRKHLGIGNQKSKVGTLTALRNSLSSVFSKKSVDKRRENEPRTIGSEHSQRLFTDKSMSRSSPELRPPSYQERPVFPKYSVAQPTASNLPMQSMPLPSFSGSQTHKLPQTLPKQSAGNSNHQTPHGISEMLQPHVRSNRQEIPGNHVETKAFGGDKWSSLMSRTVGILAPAGGDLSPPPRTRSDDHIPGMSETLLGRTGPSSGFDSRRNAGVAPMRASSSTGDMITSTEMCNENLLIGEASIENTQGAGHDMHGGAHVGNHWGHMSGQADDGAYRDSGEASSSTVVSKASDRKPPLPPKSSSSTEVRNNNSNSAPRGWRARIAERLLSTFGSSKRAHMGEKNKFVYDDKVGRWVIPGEEVSEDSSLPPPPPDDNELSGRGTTVLSSSVSYDDVFENSQEGGQSNHVDMIRSYSFQEDVGQNAQASAPAIGSNLSNLDSYIHNASVTTDAIEYERMHSSASLNHFNSHAGVRGFNGGARYSDAENSSNTEDSVRTGHPSAQYKHQMPTSQASRVQFSGAPTQRLSDVQPTKSTGSDSSSVAPPASNKYRAGTGRLSGKRAYVDTFNKGSKARTHGVMPPVPGANRLVIPTPAPAMGLTRHVRSGHERTGSYQIFMPNPQPSAELERSAGIGLGSDSAQTSEGEALNRSVVQDTSGSYDNPPQSPIGASFNLTSTSAQRGQQAEQDSWYSSGRGVSFSEPVASMNRQSDTRSTASQQNSGPKYPRMMA